MDGNSQGGGKAFKGSDTANSTKGGDSATHKADKDNGDDGSATHKAEKDKGDDGSATHKAEKDKGDGSATHKADKDKSNDDDSNGERSATTLPLGHASDCD